MKIFWLLKMTPNPGPCFAENFLLLIRSISSPGRARASMLGTIRSSLTPVQRVQYGTVAPPRLRKNYYFIDNE